MTNARRTRRIAWGIAAALWLFAFVMNIVWEGWNWGVMDFVFAAGYFSLAAGSVDWLSRRALNTFQRRLLITIVLVVLVGFWGLIATSE